MKINEVRGKDETELRVDLQSLRKELFELRFKGASEQNPNPSRISQVRRDVARILTVLRERDLGIVRGGADAAVAPARAGAAEPGTEPAAKAGRRRAPAKPSRKARQRKGGAVGKASASASARQSSKRPGSSRSRGSSKKAAGRKTTTARKAKS